MQNPNFLILDEPTNDLDIMTLNVLEEYLESFDGCVIIVSHDRFFMDKIADHLFVFDGKGLITDFPGNYTQYRNMIEEEASDRKPDTIKVTVESPRAKSIDNSKLTYKEKRELEQLEGEIPRLENKKKELEELLNSGTLDHDSLFSKSQEIVILSEQLEEMEMRWLELSEKG
jgi:ATP-binding cassette subfamily F protein uup